MKSQLVPVTITGANSNSSGLAFSRLAVGAPVTWPVAGIGVDQAGNVVVTDAGFRSVSVSDVANASNTTSDTSVLSVTIPANALTPGSSGNIRAFGSATSGASSTYNLWVKVGTTKVLNVSFYSGLLGAFSNNGIMLNSYFTVRSSGSSASVIFSAHAEGLGAAVQTVIANSTATFNTSSAQTVSMGFNWGNAGANNIVTVNQCIIGPT